MKILVVDDERSALSNFFNEVLDETDIDHKALLNPLDALAYAKNNRIDAAFLDIQMPHMNGVDLAEKLIEICPTTAIVFISGYQQDEAEIARRLGDNLLGFCNKPYATDKLYGFLNRARERTGENRVFAKTFGLFDLYAGGKVVKFSSSKAKELLALCIDKEGQSVSNDLAMACLWPDKPRDKASRLYRDAVIRLRFTLGDAGLAGCIQVERGSILVNKERIECDAWTARQTNNFADYFGEYMIQFAEWSAETQYVLDTKKESF